MLTAYNIHSNKAFQYLINKYVKKEGIVADITFADGLAWKDFDNKKNFKIIKSDKRKTQGDVKKQTIKEFFENTKRESLDGIYFDPPHYFKDKVSKLNYKDKDLGDEEEVYTTEKEFEEMVNIVGENAHKVLKEKGILIIKMIDGYVGTTWFPNTFNMFNNVKNLEPRGHFISVLSRKSGLPTLVQINHVNFLVFKKLKQEGGNSSQP
jgi:hypothetical protein